MAGEISTPFPWHCPFCDSKTTINRDDFSWDNHWMKIESNDGDKILYSYFVVCPNQECKRVSLMVHLHEAGRSETGGLATGRLERQWTLIPSSKARVLPDYVPQAIRDDYSEACEIVELSPKAAATLARRAIQGMIRDFWGIHRPRLVEEIDALRDKVDAGAWQAIDAVRMLGNIGAHMEQDVNLVVDVEPDEASMLINLVENLIQDWYVARHDREERQKKIVEMSAAKQALREGKP